MRYQKLNMMRARRGARRKMPAWLIAVPIVVLVISVGLFLAFPFVRAATAAVHHIDAGQAGLEETEKAVQRLDLPAALESLTMAQEEFAAARTEIGRLQPLAFLPYVGKRIAAATVVVDGGLEAMDGMQEALKAADNVLAAVGEGEDLSSGLMNALSGGDVPFSDLTPEDKRRLLEALDQAADRIGSAVMKLDSAAVALRSVPPRIFDDRLSDALASATGRIESLRDTLTEVEPATKFLPALLGHGEDSRYLLFFMNNTELRPTGGFLGVYGLVTMRDAEIIELDTNDVYYLDGPSEALARPAPPEPIRKYIRIDKWYLRDANWSPDFPTSAQVMERFYMEEAAVIGEDTRPIDGIIAVTPEVAADILRIIGPITVQGKTFDADGFTDQLEFAVERDFVTEGIPFFARKDIIGVLMEEMIDRLSSLPLADLLSVVRSVGRNFDESQAMAWMKDRELQAYLLKKDWAGAMRPVTGDYLSVIDANLAALKSDPAIDRSIYYSVYPGVDGSYEARVDITYEHNGSFDWKTTRYRTYTRIYVPRGSELLSVEGAMIDDKLRDPARRPGAADTYEELDRTAFGAFISIEPGETRTLEFRYLLPPSVTRIIDAGDYRLTVEKQPGTTGHGLTLELDFGKKLTNAVPAEEPSEWGDEVYRYSTDLRIDREFTVDTEGN